MQNRPFIFSLLICLYFSQGLPSGLLGHALPALMREYGVSLQWIGMIKILALPWFLKFLWAPYIDQRWQRKNWILLFQSCVIPLVFIISFLPPEAVFGQWLIPFLCLLLLLNTLSASQDIATDGLAVDTLPQRWLGMANSIQVAAYKVGLILGGSYLLVMMDTLGWQNCFQLFALLLLLALIPVFRLQPGQTQASLTSTSTSTDSKPEISPKQAIKDYLSTSHAKQWLLILMSYKVADELGSSMLKPLLVDMQYSLSDIGYITSVASVCGLVGAGLSGLLFTRISTYKALLLFGILQAIGIGLFALIPTLQAAPAMVYAIVMFEQFVDGLSTVVIFAAMMQHCRKGLEGTDYTLQNSIHIIGLGIAAMLSGFLANALGYTAHFLLAGLLGLLALLLIVYSDDPRIKQESHVNT